MLFLPLDVRGPIKTGSVARVRQAERLTWSGGGQEPQLPPGSGSKVQSLIYRRANDTGSRASRVRGSCLPLTSEPKLLVLPIHLPTSLKGSKVSGGLRGPRYLSHLLLFSLLGGGRIQGHLDSRPEGPQPKKTPSRLPGSG